MTEPTRSQLEAYWAAMTASQRGSFMDMAANCGVTYDFANYLQRYAVSADAALRKGVPEAALAALRGAGPLVGTFTVFGFEKVLLPDLPDRAFLAKHPTMGWFVAVADADVNVDPGLVWNEPMPSHILALACVKRAGDSLIPPEPGEPVSEVDEMLYDLLWGD